LVLEELGVWCADKACLSLIIRIEKLKVKTPYERHFLLLCLVSTTLIQARAYCEHIFQSNGKTVKENVLQFSAPKICRLIEILKLYQPSDPPTPKINEQVKIAPEPPNITEEIVAKSSDSYHCQSLLNEITKLDLKLSLKMDNVSKIFDNMSNELDNLKRSMSTIGEVTGIESQPPVKVEVPPKNGLKSPTKSVSSPDCRNPANRNRNNRRKPMRPRNNQNSQDSDILCGLIFCSSKFTTRILFNLLLELTRNDPDLSYLCVQYILDKVADPAVDAKEADAEHRKQEEVLKRFRMRECNLLIGTSVLEEGIDLPKCNLVIRWDPPTNYRSYVQCKGRARAYYALYIIMVAPQVQFKRRAVNECLSNKNHRYICNLVRGGEEVVQEVAAPVAVVSEETVDECASVKSDDSSVDDDSDEIVNYNIKCVVPVESDDDDDYNEDDDDDDENEMSEEERKRLTMEQNTDQMIDLLAQYMEIEKTLIRKCENTEPPEAELVQADRFTPILQPYSPKGEVDSAFVNLANAVSLINKYCAKLPSDTFTKLTPLWRGAQCQRNGIEMFQCTLRLPINSPIKYDILVSRIF
jgi:endoribonuclease Dicer